ncbi:MAG: HNH endonuclease, partial [Syntrophales bacterium]|nr:HNH endonuclease [Syntrophales bacterium]
MSGFSKAIRDQVLVETARHCSVCHRFKAIGVEVHHILPRAEGGQDTEDNAIALCMDCHLAAGHYNSRHPKGTRYSTEELRKHKAAWIQTVARGSIQVPVSADELSVICRHVVTCDGFAIDDVLALNKERLPFGQFFLLEVSPILNHIRECFSQENLFTGYMDRRSYTGLLSLSDYDRYETAEEFHKAHPEFAGAETR